MDRRSRLRRAAPIYFVNSSQDKINNAKETISKIIVKYLIKSYQRYKTNNSIFSF